jgi:hypothetical protein
MPGRDGAEEWGTSDGRAVGTEVGTLDVGRAVGSDDGTVLGWVVGSPEGEVDGCDDGVFVG